MFPGPQHTTVQCTQEAVRGSGPSRWDGSAGPSLGFPGETGLSVESVELWSVLIQGLLCRGGTRGDPRRA